MHSQISLVNNESGRVPSINSNDPAERKLARRLRIKARVEAAEKEKAISDGTYVEPEPEKPIIDEAIDTSEDTLQRLYMEGKEQVTNVMIASDAKEVERRETEEEERNKRLDRLKEESTLALQKLDEISNQWDTIMQISGPLELYQHMKEQKAKCLELIEEKNDLIKSFQLELKIAEEKFMKGRKAMYEELALLTRRIDEQVLLMKRAYRLELDNIEESVDVTRKEILSKHQSTWEHFYRQREKEEVSNIGSKFTMVENFHEELHKLHVNHEERFRAARIHYETDIQTLEQELEQVKALCLLNSEKLDYNYQVLKKREEENVYIKNHQKRRLNKLQDAVNSLKKKIDEKRESTDEEYKKLLKDVERYYANVIATEKKAERFSHVNNDKFESIWDMKDEEARDLMEKILSADMIINEQILGLDWTPPPNTNFNKRDLVSYNTAIFVINNVLKKNVNSEQTQRPRCDKSLREGETLPEVLEGHKRLLRHIFELIADQSGFLMEEKLDKLLSPYTEDEKTLVRLDNVFVAIGIRTEKDIEEMKKVFLPYTVCLVCDKGETSGTSIDLRLDAFDLPKSKTSSRQHSILQIRELEEKVSKLRMQAKTASESKLETEVSEKEESSGVVDVSQQYQSSNTKTSNNSELPRNTPPTTDKYEIHSMSEEEEYQENEPEKVASNESVALEKCDITHPLVIEKYFVLKALKDFVSIYHSDRLKALSGIEQKLDHKRFTVSRLLTKEDMVSYWQNYREVIPDKLENKWNGVIIGLTKYLALLQRRHELNLKARSLRRQNLDMKRLLAYYKITDDYKFPKVLPVPNSPISTEEIIAIFSKLGL